MANFLYHIKSEKDGLRVWREYMDTAMLNEFIAAVRSAFPEKTIVDISDYENADHQTYKYMYENQIRKIEELTEENFNLQFAIQDSEREMARLREELEM